SAEPLTRLAYNYLTLADIFDPTSYTGLGLGGMILVPLTVAAGVWLARKGRRCRRGWVFLAVGAALTFATLNWVPWSKLDETVLTSVQFPWRLNAFGQMFLCLGAACLLAGLSAKRVRAAALAACFCLSLVNLAC